MVLLVVFWLLLYGSISSPVQLLFKKAYMYHYHQVQWTHKNTVLVEKYIDLEKMQKRGKGEKLVNVEQKNVSQQNIVFVLDLFTYESGFPTCFFPCCLRRMKAMSDRSPPLF